MTISDQINPPRRKLNVHYHKNHRIHAE